MTVSRAYLSWTLRGLGDEELLVLPLGAPRPARHQILPPMFPVGYLAGWLREPDARRVLVAMFTALHGPLELDPWASDEIVRRIGPALQTAFERGDLVVLAAKRVNATPPVRVVPVSAPPPPGLPTTPKTFIEIVLLDDRGQPLAGEPYRIVLPDGSIRTGTLDRDGFAREDNLDPGVCDVSFPRIDGREWGTRRQAVPR